MGTILGDQEVLQIATWGLLLLYVFFCTIVLMNLMIAVMNNEYDSIVKFSLIEAKRERYAIMDDLQTSTGVMKLLHKVTCGRLRERKEARFPRYLAMYSRSTKNDFYGYGSGEGNEASTSGPMEAKGGGGSSDVSGYGASAGLDLRILGPTVSHFTEMERLLLDYGEGTASGGQGTGSKGSISTQVAGMELELRKLRSENKRLQELSTQTGRNSK